MNCHEVESWLSAYVDRELDLERSLELEAHLAQCEECARAAQRLEELAATVASARRYPASAELRRRLARGNPVLVWQAAPWLVAAASLAVAVLAIWRLSPVPAAPRTDVLERDIVQEHVRSLLADHLVDVRSTDRQRVKPWFNGRLDYAPEVADLSPQGFQLTGGRLDYLGGRVVAALVYQRRGHIINVFVWPEPGQPDRAPAAHFVEGFNVVSWRSHGSNWWAVSDLNEVEMEQLPVCPCFLASVAANWRRDPS